MNTFNKKTILFFSISTLMMNGCMAKSTLNVNVETKMPSYTSKVSKLKKSKKSWKKVKAKSLQKEDCIDCYATPIKPTQKVEKYIGKYNYTVEAQSYIEPVIKYVNTSKGKYSTRKNIAIQVGAFSRYKGAKVYKKRYNALSSKYRVSIETGSKNQKPLHRVRIEGFTTKKEAKIFMNRYGIRNAFIVSL